MAAGLLAGAVVASAGAAISLPVADGVTGTAGITSSEAVLGDGVALPSKWPRVANHTGTASTAVMPTYSTRLPRFSAMRRARGYGYG